jgi:hypothetical protein
MGEKESFSSAVDVMRERAMESNDLTMWLNSTHGFSRFVIAPMNADEVCSDATLSPVSWFRKGPAQNSTNNICLFSGDLFNHASDVRTHLPDDDVDVVSHLLQVPSVHATLFMDKKHSKQADTLSRPRHVLPHSRRVKKLLHARRKLFLRRQRKSFLKDAHQRFVIRLPLLPRNKLIRVRCLLLLHRNFRHTPPFQRTDSRVPPTSLQHPLHNPSVPRP